jgi:hypothetical protein
MLSIHWARSRNLNPTFYLLKIWTKTIFRLQNRKNVTFSEFFWKPSIWTKIWRFAFFPTRYYRSCSNFLISTSIELGCMSFFLKNLVRAKFGRFYKISSIEKNTFFDGIFSILILLNHRNRKQYFSSKKTRILDLFLVVRKKFQLWNMKYKYSQGAQIFFSPCDSHIFLKGTSGNLESGTTFAELIKIYLPRKFHKFWLSRSRETPEKWGLLKKSHREN